jgi:hypothetical protein
VEAVKGALCEGCDVGIGIKRRWKASDCYVARHVDTRFISTYWHKTAVIVLSATTMPAESVDLFALLAYPFWFHGFRFENCW